jgi:hypothetical protein
VKLPVGDRVNQLLLAQLCSEVAAVPLVLLCAVTVKVWEAGAVPPARPLKVKAEELSVRAPAAAVVTFRVTVAACVPADVVKEIVPEHTVPAAMPD